MEIINNYSYIIPILMDYFNQARVGPHHPYHIQSALMLSRKAWREAVKKHIYPKDSTGRKALASIGVTIHEVSVTHNPKGEPQVNSIFLKSINDDDCLRMPRF